MANKRVLIIVENLPSPFDRRVWQEATTLTTHGYTVSIICPKGKGYEKSYEEIDGIHSRGYLGAIGLLKPDIGSRREPITT